MTPEVSQAFTIGPIAFWTILGASVLCFSLALGQLYLSWGLVEGARKLGLELSTPLYRGELQAVRSACERSLSPVADVFIAALNKVNQNGESTSRAAERQRQRLGMSTKRWLWAIGTIGATAPFIGLFGTVVGIIRAFKDIAAAGSGGFSVVAQGVSEALVATAGGILIAVIAVCLYNFLQARANHATIEIRLIVDEFLEQLDVAIENPQLSQRPSSIDPLMPSSVPLAAAASDEE
jgi:biopolymer transport protein ExbB/TolQ